MNFPKINSIFVKPSFIKKHVSITHHSIPKKSYASVSKAPDNYYTVLGVSPTANKADIKKRFYQLSMIYHPDKNKDEASHKKFLIFNEAYSILADDDRRRDYDRSFMAQGHRGSSRNSSFSNKHRARPATYVRQYPANVQFRPGFKFGGKDGEPKYDTEEHQRKHYPTSPDRRPINNTPFRYPNRVDQSDIPKMESMSTTVLQMSLCVSAFGLSYWAVNNF